MAKYKVKTLALCVKNNRIARHGELVDDSELTVNPSELISTGFIDLVVEAKVETEAKVEETPANVTEPVAPVEEATTEVIATDDKPKAKGAAAKVADATTEAPTE